MTDKQYFCAEEFLKQQKTVLMHSNGVCVTVGYHKKLEKVER